jgi:hypothetical protein
MKRARVRRIADATRHRRHELIAARDYPRLLRLVVDRLFPGPREREAVDRMLAEYGSAPDEPQAERVRLAILKLADGDISLLPEHIAGAKEDYEDILFWAESPPDEYEWWLTAHTSKA